MGRTKEERQPARERIIQESYERIRKKDYGQMTRDDITKMLSCTDIAPEGKIKRLIHKSQVY